MRIALSSLLKNALLAFFHLAKFAAKLLTARKITTYVALFVIAFLRSSRRVEFFNKPARFPARLLPLIPAPIIGTEHLRNGLPRHFAQASLDRAAGRAYA